MLVTLDQSETAKIIKEWAYKVYKTHNINVNFDRSNVVLEVIGFETPEEKRTMHYSNIMPSLGEDEGLNIPGPSLDSSGV